MNTHYGVLVSSAPPEIVFIAAGSCDYCWKHLDEWVKNHPLRKGEVPEVLKRTAVER